MLTRIAATVHPYPVSGSCVLLINGMIGVAESTGEHSDAAGLRWGVLRRFVERS